MSLSPNNTSLFASVAPHQWPWFSTFAMNNGNREHVSVCKSAPPPQCGLHTQTLSLLLCLWQLPSTLILVDDGIVWISCQSLVVTAMSSNPPCPELSLALLFPFSTRAPMYCGCSVAQTIRMSLQPNVQRWHLAERPPHPNFLSFSLLLTINYCQCATLC